MKKILAFVLASLMVLSLVPASAFAAITKCPAIHTSTNCDATQVGDPVPATCKKAGYTEYVCNTCGEQFVDNLTPKAEHTWVSDTSKNKNDILANCVYKADGKQYLKCSVCKVVYKETIDGVEYDYKTIDYRSVHDLEYVSGLGCEKIYACTLCGEEGYLSTDDLLVAEVEHDWEFTSVSSEPYWSDGKKHEGYAVFTCKECGVPKSTPINTPACNHPSHTDKTYAVKVKDVTKTSCTVDGYNLVVKCPDCNMHWTCGTKANDSAITTCKDNHNTMAKHSWVELTDSNNNGNFYEHAKKSKYGHPAANRTQHKDTNGDTRINCGEQYYCTKCNTWQTEGHGKPSWKEEIIIKPATCTDKGSKYQICSCGYVNTTTVKSSVSHTKHTVYIPATCANPAMTFTECTSATCPQKPQVINGVSYNVISEITTIGTPNSNGHTWWQPESDSGVNADVNLGNINPDLYCDGISYKYMLCLNGCEEYGQGQTIITQSPMHELYMSAYSHNYSKSEGGLQAYAAQITWMCSKCDWAGKTEVVADTTIKNSFDSAEEALLYFGFIRATYEWDAEKGEAVLDQYFVREAYKKAPYNYAENNIDGIKAYALKELAGSATVAATCTTPSLKTYSVTGYNVLVTVLGPMEAHIAGKTSGATAATCVKAGKRATSTCLNCNTVYWTDDNGVQHTSSAVLNPCYNTVVYQDPTCGNEKGYWKCSKCNTCYADRECSVKTLETDHNYTVLVAGVPATCNTAGYPEVRYCADCKKVEINLIYMNGGAEVRVNFASATASYGTIGDSVTIGTEWLSEAVTVTLSAEGKLIFVYDNLQWSEWPVAVTVNKTETDAGHRGIYLKNATTKTLASGVVAVADVKFDNSVSESQNVKYIELDHTKPSFKVYNCAACVYEFIDNYTASAGGHINSDGELIDVNGCNDDAVCTICKAYAEAHPTENVTYEYGAHDYKVVGSSNVTCSTSGYVATRCTKCGEYDIAGENVEVVDADAWHEALLEGELWDAAEEEGYLPVLSGNSVVADYANNGAGALVCPVCNKELEKLDDVKCPGAGLEIYLSTDAESYIPGSKVYVTVTLDSLMGVNVWGLTFPVLFNANVFAFNGYEFNTAHGDFQTFAANEVPGGYKAVASNEDPFRGHFGPVSKGEIASSGIISIVASADDEVLVKGAQTLVVLEFTVISAAAAEDVYFEVAETEYSIGAKLVAIEDAQFPGYYQIVTAEGSKPQQFKIDVINGSGKSVNAVYAAENQAKSNKSNYVAITEFLDIDGVGGRTMKDAYELYYLICNNAYDVKADADFDGNVTAMDLAILYNLITGVTTVESIVIPASTADELPPEGTIMPR